MDVSISIRRHRYRMLLAFRLGALGRSQDQPGKTFERSAGGPSGSHPSPLVHDPGDRQPGVGLVLTHDSLGNRAKDAVDRAGVTKADLEHALQHGHDRPKRSGLQRRRRLAVRVYVAPCDWTDNAVHYQPDRLLEVLHGLLRLRSKDPGVIQFDGRRHVNSSPGSSARWPQKSCSMSFLQVNGPTRASVARWAAVWKASTACFVFAPAAPSSASAGIGLPSSPASPAVRNRFSNA